MERFDRITNYGEVPSLETTIIEEARNPTGLLVKTFVPYSRFAVRVADDGMDAFGLRKGSYAVFGQQRYPTQECSVCLVRFGEEVTIRVLEGIYATLVTLRVAGSKIPPLEVTETDFTVVGVLDGVILDEFTQLSDRDMEEFNWGC